MKVSVLGIMGAAVAAVGVACSSTSGGGTPDGGSSSGASSSGTGGSGAGSGGTSGSGSSGSGASSGTTSGSGSSSGGANGGATQIAAGIAGINSLTFVGSTLYWVSTGSTSAIQSVPVTGGTVSTILSDPSLNGDLASDGTHLFYTTLPDGGPGLDVVSISLTGAGRTVLANEGGSFLTNPDASQLFVLNGSVYFPTTQGPASVPIGGGSAAVPLTQDAAALPATLLWVDASGAYFLTEGGSAPAIADVPLPGGNANTLVQFPTSVNAGGLSGEFLATSGKAYYVEEPLGSLDSTLFTAPTPFGPGSSLATYTKQGGFTLLLDGTNLFAVEQRGDNNGIFRVNASTGALTSLWSPSLGGNNGPSGQATFDATHFYFASESGGTFTLWSVPR